MSDNPYAAPEATQRDVEVTGIVAVETKLVTVQRRAELPGRCVVTNSTDDLVRQSRTLAWSPPWVLFVILFCGGLIGIILYFVTREQLTISYSINRGTRNRRRVYIITSLLISAIGVALAAFGIQQESPAAFATGLVTFLLTIIIANYLKTPFRIHDFRNEKFRLKGFNTQFATDLDQWLLDRWDRRRQ